MIKNADPQTFRLPSSRFAKYTWGVLAYNVLVILWGAYVRATGSGAGCGSHWPTCNGEVLPRAPQIETIVEFTHRLSSGAAFLLVVGLLIWTMRSYPKGHRVRKAAGAALIFIVTESLVGAGLVLFEWVAGNISTARVIVMGIHLLNTHLLLASLTLAGWWASGGQPITLKGQSKSLVWGLGIGLIGVLILSMAGAVTALGDTLFPAGSLAEGIRQDFSAASHFIVRLRVWHPVIATLVGFYVIFFAWNQAALHPNPTLKRLAWAEIALFVIQLIAGMINLLLLAPVFMQIIHLLLADLVWIVLVLLAAVALVTPAAEMEKGL
jgi:heme A synthase